MGCQLRLLETLLEHTDDCPPLVLLLPKPHKAGVFEALKRGARSVINSKEYRCMFLCQCCMQSSCGPRGKGYPVRNPSALLKAAAPVVALALKLLVAVAAVAAKTASGGVIEVTLPGGLSLSDAAEELEVLADLLESEAEFALEEVVSALASGGQDSGIGGKAPAPAGAAKFLTGDAYARLKSFLVSVDPLNRSKLHPRLGLERVLGGKGTDAAATQWVCYKCKPGFEKAGADFLPN